MILEARWPDGGIQAQWINPTPEQQANFRKTMTRQGCTVQAFDDQQYLKILEQRRSQKAQKRAPKVKRYAPDNVVLRRTLLRMRTLERYRVRHPLPKHVGPLNDDQHEQRLLWYWKKTADEIAAYVDVRRSFAAAMLFGRNLTGYGFHFALNFIDAQLRRQEITPAEAESRRAALRGPEYFRMWGPWGTTFQYPNPDYRPPENDVPDEAVHSTGRSLDRNHEKSSEEEHVPVRENQRTGLTLPELGVELVHPDLGWATVTHIITLEGQPLPVATGPRGQGLVRPGQWRVATEADRPFWMRAEPVVEVSPPPPPGRKPSVMPSLF